MITIHYTRMSVHAKAIYTPLSKDDTKFESGTLSNPN
jgi:hypothetical protein